MTVTRDPLGMLDDGLLSAESAARGGAQLRKPQRLAQRSVVFTFPPRISARRATARVAPDFDA
ncbi:hypothetical protein BH11MYX4_BH11MYX4_33380 [soil metagenome]